MLQFGLVSSVINSYFWISCILSWFVLMEHVWKWIYSTFSLLKVCLGKVEDLEKKKKKTSAWYFFWEWNSRLEVISLRIYSVPFLGSNAVSCRSDPQSFRCDLVLLLLLFFFFFFPSGRFWFFIPGIVKISQRCFDGVFGHLLCVIYWPLPPRGSYQSWEIFWVVFCSVDLLDWYSDLIYSTISICFFPCSQKVLYVLWNFSLWKVFFPTIS